MLDSSLNTTKCGAIKCNIDKINHYVKLVLIFKKTCEGVNHFQYFYRKMSLELHGE